MTNISRQLLLLAFIMQIYKGLSSPRLSSAFVVLKSANKNAYKCYSSIADGQTGNQKELLTQEQFAQRTKGKAILAPLTRGGNVPFRRLCADFGARATLSEMVYARELVRGRNSVEKAKLRRAPGEETYGLQIATNSIDEGTKAINIALQSGAVDWVDLNCGCPIHDTTRRGLGASLLKRPHKLVKLVEGIAANSPVPFTVKIRLLQDQQVDSATGHRDGRGGGNKYDDRSSIADVGATEELVLQLMEAGAGAVTIHGRTEKQRYGKAANWDAVQSAARAVKETGSAMPVIGNGDVLTYYEANDRFRRYPDVHAVMVGRGALHKPWIFKEIEEQAPYEPTTKERVEIYYRLVRYMMDHFGNDQRGKKAAFYFLPWHLDLLARYRPLPPSLYEPISSSYQPLIQNSRLIDEVAVAKACNKYSLTAPPTQTAGTITAGGIALPPFLSLSSSISGADSVEEIHSRLFSSPVTAEEALAYRRSMDPLDLLLQHDGEEGHIAIANTMWDIVANSLARTVTEAGGGSGGSSSSNSPFYVKAGGGGGGSGSGAGVEKSSYSYSYSYTGPSSASPTDGLIVAKLMDGLHKLAVEDLPSWEKSKGRGRQEEDGADSDDELDEGGRRGGREDRSGYGRDRDSNVKGKRKTWQQKKKAYSQSAR